MAIVLVDTCVIADLANLGSDCFEWSASTLERLDDQHEFVINPIIYAECSIGYDSIEEMDALMTRLDFTIIPLPRAALFLAGKAFLQYRKKGQKLGAIFHLFLFCGIDYSRPLSSVPPFSTSANRLIQR